MRTVPLIHIVNDNELEEKMAELEERCKNLQNHDVSLECLLQAAITDFPMKTYMTALIMWVDDKVFELEQAEKNKQFWNKFKIHKKDKEKKTLHKKAEIP